MSWIKCHFWPLESELTVYSFRKMPFLASCSRVDSLFLGENADPGGEVQIYKCQFGQNVAKIKMQSQILEGRSKFIGGSIWPTNSQNKNAKPDPRGEVQIYRGVNLANKLTK